MKAALARHGAVRLRGAAPNRGQAAATIDAVIGPLVGYGGGVGHKKPVVGGLYTASELPGPLRLWPHHELSYTPRPPRWMAFYCERPAQQGGDTPLLCGRRLAQALPRALVERFAARGLRYSRHLPRPRPWSQQPGGPIVTWADAFGVSTVAEAVAAARAAGLEAVATPAGDLFTYVTLPALRPDPVTGAPVWFNQAHAFVPTRRGLGWSGVVHAALAGRWRGLQRSTVVFGDGSPIPVADIHAILSAMEALQGAEPWEAGDLLLLDNHRVMHGRMPFVGARAVYVGLGA